MRNTAPVTTPRPSGLQKKWINNNETPSSACQFIIPTQKTFLINYTKVMSGILRGYLGGGGGGGG